ncbi:MAG: M20/M25/M40 family metallo-hydrolase [Intestinibacter sp.]|uniref:M20/M25/M40 family metallo-hydrolase n=1 Tax=Intestinibacter sp. TaxID=1965304 RepID=UPI002A7EE20D|nr:M20/M25/M40 family metallo-hydrolase [Intestinibacter sp.]MDY4576154.1 M20/M25/M40 family metallo-hydrolase [Intestinibacter sp.]
MYNSKEELLNLTLELVKEKTISSTSDEKYGIELVSKKLMEIDYFKKNPNNIYIGDVEDDLGRTFLCALYKSKKKTDKTVILIGHIDTADIENAGNFKDFILKPYEYTRVLEENIELLDEESRDDLLSQKYLFGRGIMDMKMGVAMEIATLEYYSERDDFEGNLLMVTVPDEESNSKGLIKALPLLNKIIEKENLKPVAVLNAEPDFGNYPGDDGKYIYTGSCGKLLLGVYSTGVEVHVGESMCGLNTNLISSQIIQNLELNVDLCEKVENEYTMPPTCLKYEDSKKVYNVQMPQSSIMYYNLQVFEKRPFEIVNEIKSLCQKSAENTINLVNQSRKKYEDLGNKIKIDQNLNINVFTFDEIYEKAYKKYGEKFELDLKENIKIWIKDKSLDERDVCSKIVDFVSKYIKEKDPMIVIFFAPPYYPSVGAKEDDENYCLVKKIVENVQSFAKKELDEEINTQRYFKGLSDLSYFSLRDSEEVIKYLKPNMPSLGYNYDIPFDEIKKLNLPVFSFGAHGKDPHKWTERILVDYSFEKVPVIFRNLIENIVHIL